MKKKRKTKTIKPPIKNIEDFTFDEVMEPIVQVPKENIKKPHGGKYMNKSKKKTKTKSKKKPIRFHQQ